MLSPTRELASQIAESFRTYGKHLGLTVTTVFGGVGHRPQMQALLRGVDVVVATPGRLIDHMNEGNILLASTEVLVLDEADQMMDLGFIKPLRQIISKLSSKRQSMFFSATMPQEIGSLAAELLRDPYRVSVTPVAKTADRVAQKVVYVEQQKKRALLVELFGDQAMTRTLIFTRTKRGADRVARHLEVAGIPVAAIHGNKSQGQREAALAAFKNDKIRALSRPISPPAGIDVVGDQPRRQLRDPQHSGELCPSHRPHCARRRRGHCHLARRQRGARLPQGHREADASADPVRGPTQRCRPEG